MPAGGAPTPLAGCAPTRDMSAWPGSKGVCWCWACCGCGCCAAAAAGCEDSRDGSKGGRLLVSGKDVAAAAAWPVVAAAAGCVPAAPVLFPFATGMTDASCDRSADSA